MFGSYALYVRTIISSYVRRGWLIRVKCVTNVESIHEDAQIDTCII